MDRGCLKELCGDVCKRASERTGWEYYALTALYGDGGEVAAFQVSFARPGAEGRTWLTVSFAPELVDVTGEQQIKTALESAIADALKNERALYLKPSGEGLCLKPGEEPK